MDSTNGYYPAAKQAELSGAAPLVVKPYKVSNTCLWKVLVALREG
jgi:hypothetical protein